MKIKKLFATLLITGLFLISTFSPAMADTGQSVYFSYYTYSGAGCVDGSANGVFYTLNSGQVSIEVSDKTGTGSIGVTLKRSVLGFDPEYGTAYVSDSPTEVYYNVNTNSSSYYLFAFGGNAQTWMSLTGSMHNHY